MSLIASPYTSPASNGASAVSLAARLAANEVRAVVTFAGQGVDVLDELATLVAQRPELLSGAELASDVLGEVAASDLGLASGAYRHGTDVAAWVMDPDGAPPLRTCAAPRSPTRCPCWRRRCSGGRSSPTRSGRASAPWWASRVIRRACSRRRWSPRRRAA